MKDRLTTNTGLKIIALLLAAITWFFVRSITSETRTVENVPLEIKVRPGLTLLQASVSTVNVAIRGTREDVRQVARPEVAAVLDLTSEDRPGLHTVRIGANTIRHPPRVQVVQVAPASVTVRVDEMIDRELAVKPLLTGELAAGLVIERTNIVPALVWVRGPKSLVDAMTNIETLPIDLSGRRVSFREWVHLALPDPNVKLLKQSWIEADVRINENPR